MQAIPQLAKFDCGGNYNHHYSVGAKYPACIIPQLWPTSLHHCIHLVCIGSRTTMTTEDAYWNSKIDKKRKIYEYTKPIQIQTTKTKVYMWLTEITKLMYAHVIILIDVAQVIILIDVAHVIILIDVCPCNNTHRCVYCAQIIEFLKITQSFTFFLLNYVEEQSCCEY